MNTLIVGAGVAGLTLARCLHDSGHTVTVIEKSPTIRTQGYMIDFTGTGWDVADRLGLIPEIKKRAYPAESVIYKDAKDKITAQISVTELLSATGNTVNYAALNRRDLVLTLYENVCQHVDIQFGKTVDTIQQSTESVQVTFSDGLQADYDLLFGCDGIHSQIRRMVFGDDEQYEHFMGYQFAIFEIPPLPHDLHKSYHMHVQPNMQVAVYPTEADKWLVFVTFKSETDAIPAQGERIPALKAMLKGMSWYVPEIFDAVTDNDYVFWDNLTQIHMPQWGQGRVALIGDSAYCPTLVSGQGASMAMAGAYFLAEALKETSDHTLAFQTMDARLRPHIEKIQQSAQDFASTFVPKSWLRIHIVNWVLKFSNIPMFQGIIGKQFTVNSILD